MVLGILGAILVGLLPWGAVYRVARPRGGTDRGVHAPGGLTGAAAPDLPLGQGVALAHGSLAWAMRTFPPLLVSLARRGHVTLVREPDPESDHDEAERLRVERRVPPAGAEPEGDPLTPFEREFLDAVEEHPGFQDFMAKGTKFQSEALEESWQALEEDGYVVRRRGRSGAFIALACMVLVAGLVGVYLAVNRTNQPDHVTIPALAGVLALALGLVGAGSLTRDHTPLGSSARKSVIDWQKELRDEIAHRADAEPRAAGELLVAELEWLLADPHVSGTWLREIEQKLADGGIELELPDWLRASTGKDPELDDGQLLSFVPLYYLLFVSSPGGGGAHAGGFPVGGAGAAGSFGGGGGGIR
jgi:hypothetical protein